MKNKYRKRRKISEVCFYIVIASKNIIDQWQFRSRTSATPPQSFLSHTVLETSMWKIFSTSCHIFCVITFLSQLVGTTETVIFIFTRIVEVEWFWKWIEYDLSSNINKFCFNISSYPLLILYKIDWCFIFPVWDFVWDLLKYLPGLTGHEFWCKDFSIKNKFLVASPWL